jgi:hypothetical protein
MRYEIDFDHRRLDSEAESSYQRFVKKSGALSTGADSIRLLKVGGSEVTVEEFLDLFNLWPIWDKDERDLIMGWSNTGFGIRIKDWPPEQSRVE